MMVKTIKIDNVKEVYEFVEVCSKSKRGLDIYATRGKVNIPCVSIMGMFSLDTSIPFEVEYPECKETEDFEKYISKFYVGYMRGI